VFAAESVLTSKDSQRPVSADRRGGGVRSTPALVAACLCLFPLAGANPAAAEPIAQRSLALEGEIAGDGSRVEFDWPRATGSKVGRVEIQRRLLGQTGKQTWRNLESVRSFARVYRDEDVRPGVAYEYRISRPSKERIDTGYWTTGVQVPAVEQRGVALVVVDESIASDLAPRLDRFLLDLAGDGWQVVRHDVPRGSDKDPVANLSAARKIRGWIQDRYNSAFYLDHALVLVGRVPVVRSGKAKPDGHQPRPLETDLFYADTNAIWLDDGQGVLLHNIIPGDHIEMQVGRIDFSGLDDSFGDEISLLRRYFDKNHNWRHGRLGDLRQAYGGSDHLFVEENGLRNIVGAENVVAGGHHDAGTRKPWLLGVDFGSSQYSKYASAEPIEAVFTINFGSGKLDFSKRNNTMKAMLAQPWYCLTTGWGGRPAWQLHHMALGKSIGYSHMRTVNNGSFSQGGYDSREYVPTGNYPWINPVWVNLLGDPTLRPFPAEPVQRLRARAVGDSVQLDWADAQAGAGRQYRIYRAAARFGPYTVLNPGELHGDLGYIDKNPIPGAWYMVRARSLKQVHAGSFYRYSQGAFARPGNRPPRAVDQSLSTAAGQALRIRLSATDPDGGDVLTIAPVRGADAGRLVASGAEWSFIPEPGFSGTAAIPFTVFDGTASDDGLISIDVHRQ
jgi:hypothetical protein